MITVPSKMMAVVTHGNGGYDMLEYKLVNTPKPINNEVIIKVLAAGINNTEINTRLGWYSPLVNDGTEELNNKLENGEIANNGGWNGSTKFPLIQGTDCCGQIVKLAKDDKQNLIGKRVIVRSCMRINGFGSKEKKWMASDFNGAFAEYVKVPLSEVFTINCDWSNEELATIPCSYGTAENMLYLSRISKNDIVLITGASGGVGSAAIQLAKIRGAKVIASIGKEKKEYALKLGANQTIDRNDNVLNTLGYNSVDLVVDVVGGSQFQDFFKIIKPNGRYISSGAIAGPIVNFDLRDLYLKDISIIGSTTWEEPIFHNLVKYIEDGLIKPLVAKTYPLSEIVRAQKEFLLKKHFGNLVLIP